MAIFYVRPSHITKFQDCPRAYYYQYIMGWREVVESATLQFGTVVHFATTGYLIALVEGRDFSPLDVFTETWAEVQKTKVLQYSSSLGPEDLTQIGQVLCSNFPAAWRDTGLVPLIDDKGPVVERRIQAPIGNGIILTGQPDVVAMNADAEILGVDIKTPVSASSPVFAEMGDQMTAYQYLLESNAEQFGIERVAKLGYMELLKKKVPGPKGRGEGPKIQPIHVTSRRSDEEVADFKQSVIWMVDDIQRGRFPKHARMAFNTPCDMCDFNGLCKRGDTTGLKQIKPESASLLV
jgi:hypothetical protein